MKESESETSRREMLFELAEKFRDTHDAQEAARLGNELGRMIFGPGIQDRPPRQIPSSLGD